MREIKCNDIKNEVKDLIYKACICPSKDLLSSLDKAKDEEKNPLAKDILADIIKNDELAEVKHSPMCQDTGICVVYLTIGNEVYFDGDVNNAINEGVKEAYTEYYLRKSVVNDPLIRVNTGDNTPAIIHVSLTKGDKLEIAVCPKGAGSENMSRLAMLTPADGINGIIDFVLETVKLAGGKPCPPIMVGVGIGGNFEKCAELAKEALLRPLDDVNPREDLRALEEELTKKINALGIGTMGFGGTVTTLGVKVNTYPCHIASLPVACNIQCHAVRHYKKVL